MEEKKSTKRVSTRFLLSLKLFRSSRHNPEESGETIKPALLKQSEKQQTRQMKMSKQQSSYCFFFVFCSSSVPSLETICTLPLDLTSIYGQGAQNYFGRVGRLG
jgi:hypothetical protein